MDNADIAELISAYADGELGGEEARLVESLLDSDDKWRRWFSDVMTLKSAAGSAKSIARAPQSLLKKIELALDQEIAASANRDPATVRRRKQSWWTFSFVPAAAAAAFMTVFFLWPRQFDIQTLEVAEHEVRREYHFATVQDAVTYMQAETGVMVNPPSLESRGLRFKRAAKIKCQNRDGVFYSYTDSKGHKVTVFELEGDNCRLPVGDCLKSYKSEALHALTEDGCHLIYWAQEGLIIAVCTDLPMNKAVEIGKYVAKSL